MITGELKNKVDGIWDTIWTGGITSPITTLEQITYLMFMKLLDDKMPVFREQIKVGATTTINQITSAMLDKIRLPLPPKSLVEEFSRFVEQTDKSKDVNELGVAA